ncbi:MAG: hypothetical protein ACE3JP_10410 [Ectobacillus sp.]
MELDNQEKLRWLVQVQEPGLYKENPLFLELAKERLQVLSNRNY